MTPVMPMSVSGMKVELIERMVLENLGRVR